MTTIHRYTEEFGPPVWTVCTWETYPERYKEHEWKKFGELLDKFKGG